MLLQNNYLKIKTARSWFIHTEGTAAIAISREKAALPDAALLSCYLQQHSGHLAASRPGSFPCNNHLLLDSCPPLARHQGKKNAIPPDKQQSQKLYQPFTASTSTTAPPSCSLPGSLPSATCMRHADDVKTQPTTAEQHTTSALAEGQVISPLLPAPSVSDMSHVFSAFLSHLRQQAAHPTPAHASLPILFPSFNCS